MANEDFFDERTEQSEIKTEIVRKYFWAWAKIMISNAKKQGIKDIKNLMCNSFSLKPSRRGQAVFCRVAS